MKIQSFRMFTPLPPPPQFPWLKSQKPVLCHQAWGGRVTFIQFLDHQSPLMPQPDKQRAPPRSSPPSPGPSGLGPPHPPERPLTNAGPLSSPEPLTWTEPSAPPRTPALCSGFHRQVHLSSQSIGQCSHTSLHGALS